MDFGAHSHRSPPEFIGARRSSSEFVEGHWSSSDFVGVHKNSLEMLAWLSLKFLKNWSAAESTPPDMMPIIGTTSSCLKSAADSERSPPMGGVVGGPRRSRWRTRADPSGVKSAAELSADPADLSASGFDPLAE